VIARHDGFIEPEQMAELPPQIRFALGFARMGRPPVRAGQGGLAEALSELGPSYIKLGQFLATRPDLIGEARAADLRSLQDRMAPFGMDEARAEIASQFGMPAETLFETFGPPVAAASIAQVHRASVRDPDGCLRQVAVKILRPGIEQRFATDLRAFFTAARLAERLHKPIRRLRPVAAVATLERSVAMEMDLRMEAAAMSEMAANGAADPGFRVPAVDWRRTSRRVLTSEWIDGIALSDRAGLIEAAVDLELLGNRLIEVFLRHAMRDGFFHADMHPGNLFSNRKAIWWRSTSGSWAGCRRKTAGSLPRSCGASSAATTCALPRCTSMPAMCRKRRIRRCLRRRCGRSANRFSTARPRTSRWRGC
jgi:ubiquinone biosynthesis protein